METPETLTRRNVRSLREQRRHTVRSLSALLGNLGRPILPSGITKIEDGTRRVDVGDLVALAVALGVNPNRLLLPARAEPGQKIDLTPALTVGADELWPWARGEHVLVEAEVAMGHGDRTWGEAQDDFRRHALPAGERLRDDHTAVQAAKDVLSNIRGLLMRREHPERVLPEDSPAGKSLEAIFGPGGTHGLRANLLRLIAEVDALIGDDDGR